MPIINIEELKSQIALNIYSAFTVDTNLFKKYAFKFKKSPLSEVGQNYPWITLVIPTILRDEIAKKFYDDINDAYVVSKGKLDKFLEIQIFSECCEKLTELDVKKYCKDAVNSFLQNAAEIIDSSDVDLSEILDNYFNSNPPFAGGKKKSEFPDAIALKALEEYAEDKDIKIAVISKDKDWIHYCQNSKKLFAIESPSDEVLRECMFAFKNYANAEEEIINELKTRICDKENSLSIQIIEEINRFFENSDNVECTVNSSMHCDIEYLFAEIDNIDFEKSEWSFTGKDNEDMYVQGLISIDVLIYAGATLSAWDSIDKEYIELENKTMKTEINVSIDISASLYRDMGGIDWDAFFGFTINNDTVSVDFGYVEFSCN